MKNTYNQLPGKTEAVDTVDSLKIADSNPERATFNSENVCANIMRAIRNDMHRGDMYINSDEYGRFTTSGMPKGTKVPRGYGGY